MDKTHIITVLLLGSMSLQSRGDITIIYPQTQTYVPQQSTVVVQQPAAQTQTVYVQQPQAAGQTVVVQQPQPQTVVVQQPQTLVVPQTQTVYVDRPTTAEVVIGNIAPIIRAITPLVVRPPHGPYHHCRPMPAPPPRIAPAPRPAPAPRMAPAPRGGGQPPRGGGMQPPPRR